MNSSDNRSLHEALDAWLLQELKEKTGRSSRKKEMYTRGIRQDGKWIAGIEGSFLFESFYLDLLATDPAWRGKGIGSELLRELEDECRSREIRRIFLSTQDYQALPFYLGNGFVIAGQLADIPFEGTTRYYLTKEVK